MGVELYTNLFTSEFGRDGSFIDGFFPRLEQENTAIWEEKITTVETKKAFNEMGSWKALGPDGYQPSFFKKTWEEDIRRSMCKALQFISLYKGHSREWRY